MRFVDVISAAAGALAGNRVRTLLTLLGIIIGTGCVVSMAAIGEGAQARVAQQIKAFGANVLLVSPSELRSDGVNKGRRHTLTASDATAIETLSTMARAAPSVFGTVQVVSGAHNWSTTVNGTTSGHFAIREWRLASGRMFSSDEEASAAKVAISARPSRRGCSTATTRSDGWFA